MAIVLSLGVESAAGEDMDFLGDRNMATSITHQQQWGDFGWNTAAAASGNVGAPMQIGQKTFDRGLGHHANGEILVNLRGQYTIFRTQIGVQWQGGDRGSVVFQIRVDDELVFEAGPMSDSDPVKEVEVPLEGARELRLIATDGGDGIGCDMANWAEARLVRDPRLPFFGTNAVSLNGQPAPEISAAAGGFALIAQRTGPQIAVMESAQTFTVSVVGDEEVRLVIPINNVSDPLRVMADVSVVGRAEAEVELSLAGKSTRQTVRNGESVTITTEPAQGVAEAEIVLATRGLGAETGVRWRGLRYVVGDESFDIPLVFPSSEGQLPPPVLPNSRPAIERQLIEWDWRMQDGIDTEREPRTFAEAIENLLDRGDQLVEDLTFAGVSLDELAPRWKTLRGRWSALSAAPATTESEWENLWRETHQARRRIAFQNPLSQVGPLLFVKRVPSGFSHQLNQYAGRHARPGGGVFVLDAPGESMQCRQLGSLPTGSYLHPEVSWDGRRVLFSFCETAPIDVGWRPDGDQHYDLFEMAADGADLKRLTDGPHDDFSPRYLPDGKLLFLSTRRGGFHRCGRGPCLVHTMAVANADGSEPRVISFHETHEWDPAVLNDGRVIYTRWDYVDRHAVHYQQLWSVRPDGSDVRAFYGNNTLNPVGVWEARPVPGSNRVMATAGAHHAMTAGSIILLDVTQGIDGLQSITRLTPDALFPESEFPVQHWHATAGVPTRPEVPSAEKRWPGHCYRTPYPLSEDYFLAAYSFDPLIGEPSANRANMFGVYLIDCFGNKELIYRDLSIGSLWPTPLRARPRPATLPSALLADHSNQGTFLLQNVYASWPQLPQESDSRIKRLRIIQVLPKTTPNANSPRVGLANASPGKQVLGTVPVESDGSAYFVAPAGIPLSFQALDERGMAVQTMRSLTYLQPGEQTGCVGCHEHRANAPGPQQATALASQRAPSAITPGPDGSKPFNYAILVQPMLDKHCVECHGGPDADGQIVTEGGFDLTGRAEGEFTASYNALAPLTPFSQWSGTPQDNHEPLTRPNLFGARASRLMRLLSEGHENVTLSDEELERLVTWMDTNALFYGTFNVENQALQRQGIRIAGPDLE